MFCYRRKLHSRFVIPGFVLVVFVIVVYFWRSHDASNTSLPEPKDTKEILNNDILLELKEIERQNRFDRNLYVWLISILIVTNLCLYTTIVKEKGIPNTDILKRIQKIWKSVGLFSQAETKRTAQHRLENSLCVVGFEEGETQRHHVEMAKDLVGPDKRLQMKSVVVTSPDSLVNIPPSKVLLMFVDYNERNLILEEAEDGIRRRTLDVLMKSGAEVIVVYCWELSSKNLEEGYLYAPKLGSVSKVPRLIELSKKNSVYSIYKHFNQHQKSAYQRKLKELEDFIK